MGRVGIGLIVVSLLWPSSTEAQEPLLLGLLREDTRVVDPMFRYAAGEWTSLHVMGLGTGARRDSIASLRVRFPREWFLAERWWDPVAVQVGDPDQSLKLPVQQWPGTVALERGLSLVFDRAGVRAGSFVDIRTDVPKSNSLHSILLPVLDSLEAAWVEALPGRHATIAADSGTRPPPVFTTIVRSGRYIWYELERAYVRPATDKDARCWDRSILAGWVTAAAGVIPYDFDPLRVHEAHRVTTCDAQGEGYFSPRIAFEYDGASYIVALWAEYDDIAGLRPVLYADTGTGLREVATEWRW